MYVRQSQIDEYEALASPLQYKPNIYVIFEAYLKKWKCFMHELGIAQQMAGIAISSIPPDIKNPRIERLNLKIGRLAAVVEDSLRFCFEIISKDTPLEGVELVIEIVPVVARCRHCNNEWEIDGPVFKCPECGIGKVEVLSGRELEITSLELAD